MTLKSAYTTLIFLFFSSLFMMVEAQAPQYEQQQIDKIEIIIENTAQESGISGESIKSRIRTREGDVFSQLDFDSDLKTLACEFDRVEPLLQSVGGKLQVIIKLWTKPSIRSISWGGCERIERTRLQKELGIKPCSTFDRLAFNKAFHKLKTHYMKQGFFEAELDYSIVPVPECNEVDIIITIKEGRAGRIKNLIFCGFTCEEEEEILEIMITKEYNILLSWYTQEGTYNEDAIQQDQCTIINYLQNEGYADAKVDIKVEEVCKDRINIYITAVKGEVYTFGDITFSGNTLFCDNDIWRQLAIWNGSPYSPENIRETITNITNLYGRRGYIDASVDFEPSLDCGCLKYNVKLTIEEGEQYCIGMIKVVGNCSTQTNVILHESLLIPGDVFNIEKLKLTEQKLQNVGYFKTVNVFAVKSDGPMGLGACYRDVHIEVEETTTGHFGAFAGYSSSESIFGGLNVTERNFNYRGLANVWNDGYRGLRGGGEYAHLTATFGAKSTKYVASWAKPFFMDTPWTVGFDIERANNRYISDDYEIKSWTLMLHANYRINQFVRFAWHYRLKNAWVDVETHRESNELRKEAKEPGLISASGVSLLYDSTDHPVTPRKGFRSRFDIEFVGIGGDSTFFGFGYLNTYFLELDQKSYIKYRADFRFLKPIGDTTADTIPIDERLFLGGESLVRGYRSYRIGPRFPRPNQDDPKGGISMQFYSVEIARRLHKKAEGFVFFDAGHLTHDEWEFAVPRCSVGFGARVKIIDSIPSLTLGMGFPLNAKDNNEVKKFFISIGGKF